MVLLIREEDINKASFTAEEAIAAVEDAYRQDGLGLAQDTPRREVKTKGKDLPHIAPGTEGLGQGLAYLEESKVLIISHNYRYPRRKYVTHLIDPSNGETFAIIVRGGKPSVEQPEGVYVGGFRTGAAAAIGAKYLARESIDTVGVIGTGNIGKASLICLSKVREFDKFIAHSGRRRDIGFEREMSRVLGVDFVSAEGPEEVVKKSDVLITATFAREPIVKGEWLNGGIHISGMGADCPLKAELDSTVFKRADKIVIDGPKCLTIGEIAHPISEGILSQSDIYGKIGEVVTGVKPGREGDSEITVFESDGTNIQNAGIALLIYNKVREMGLGIETSELSSFFFLNP